MQLRRNDAAIPCLFRIVLVVVLVLVIDLCAHVFDYDYDDEDDDDRRIAPSTRPETLVKSNLMQPCLSPGAGSWNLRRGWTSANLCDKRLRTRRQQRNLNERYSNMHVSVHHNITNPQQWEQVTQKMKTALEQGKIPSGLKALMYLPSADGRKADCLWEAQSVEMLRSFLDREIGTAASNDYSQINTQSAFGLPGHEEMRKAA